MSRFGWSDQQFAENMSNNFGNLLRLGKELDMGDSLLVRVLSMPTQVHRVYYPTVRRKNDGTAKEGWETIIVRDRKDNFFSALAVADKQTQLAHLPANVDPKTVKSQFEPGSAFLFAAISRTWNPNGDPEPFLVVVECSFTVATKIEKLRKEPDPRDASKLADGPTILYDVVLKAYRDPSHGPNSPDSRAKRYDAVPYQNTWQGKCPVDWKNGPPSDFDYIEQGVLTSAEMEAAEEFLDSGAVSRLLAPTSDAALFDALNKNPVNPWAVRDGKRIFPYAPELLQQFSALEIPYFTKRDVIQLVGELPVAVAGPESSESTATGGGGSDDGTSAVGTGGGSDDTPAPVKVQTREVGASKLSPKSRTVVAAVAGNETASIGAKPVAKLNF
jgi:hypothetical protein